MKEVKNQGVELLRLILMFFIVVEHFIGHGGGLLDFINSQCSLHSPSLKEWIYYTPCVMSVDCFILISGYFGIKFNIGKIQSLSFQALTTSVLLLLLGICLGCDLNLGVLLGSFFPISCNYWWFLSLYIVLMCLSPCLNSYSNLDKKSRYIILFILFWIDCVGGLIFNTAGANLGYSLLNFIFLYLLGRELCESKFYARTSTFYFLLYVITLLVLYFMVYLSNDVGPSILKRVFAYNNPVMIFNAVFFLGVFYKMPVRVNVRALSVYSFGIYLFHDNPFVRGYLHDIYKSDYMLLIPLCVFMLSLLAEILRSNGIRKMMSLFNKKS